MRNGPGTQDFFDWDPPYPLVVTIVKTLLASGAVIRGCIGISAAENSRTGPNGPVTTLPQVFRVSQEGSCISLTVIRAL
nr:hypothetical protein 220p1_00022 [Serratia entomophila]